MSNQISVTAVHNGRMKFKITSKAGYEIFADYVPPLGEGTGFMPLELLLSSLAACSGGTVVYLLSQSKINDYKLIVTATGDRALTHPTVFTEILLEFKFFGPGVTKEIAEKTLKLSEDKFCPVWAMLKDSVKITYNILFE